MAEMHEYRSTADVSPFGRWFAGPDRMILLGGGTKKRQNKDIAAVRERWRDFQIRKRGDSCH